MRKLWYLIIVVGLVGCQASGYTPDDCSETKEEYRTKTLFRGKPLPEFNALTDKGKNFTPSGLVGKRTFIFFKQQFPDGAYHILLNEEVTYQDLGMLAMSKECNLVVTNEGVIAELYGIEMNEDAQILQNALIVSDPSGHVQKIYRRTCEKHIQDLLQEIN
jgi:hypothetical protein